MKTHTITLQPPRRAGRAIFVPAALRRANSLPCLALMILFSAVPPIALVVLTTWATNVPQLLPVVQAAAGVSGFVFLALALDSGRTAAMPLVLTALALFGLSWSSMTVATELVVVASMVLAAWLGGALFTLVRRNCL